MDFRLRQELHAHYFNLPDPFEVAVFSMIWHKMAQYVRNFMQLDAALGNSIMLILQDNMDGPMKLLRQKSASQAYDEGSIPFTRSKPFPSLPRN